MRIAVIAPPFICVPPKRYGGTELFIAQLAEGLNARNIDVVVYTNGESEIGVEKRWLYDKPQWPIEGEIYDNLKDMNHTSWSVADAAGDCDVIHLNNLPGLFHSRFVKQPFVYTVHHPHEERLSGFYESFSAVHYVTISDFQRQREPMANVRTIHHGVDTRFYQCRERKQAYLSFIGRIAPIKGTHLAIEVAQKSGIPLKIAGEVQPMFREYFEREVKPHCDGRFIEYVGEANMEEKNELLGNSMAMLFPIQWNEPFGLVMIEAMACGTPVLTLPGGSVDEVVEDGVSGYLCGSTQEMVERLRQPAIPPATVRAYVEKFFSLDTMVRNYIRLYSELVSGGRAEPVAAAAEIAKPTRAVA